MRKIKEIIIHCTATPEGSDHTAAEIRQWHVKGNGWNDIGYHYIIRLDGTIEIGRPIAVVGAHCIGHNAESIGICYVGGLDAVTGRAKDTRTPEQKKALLTLIRTLRAKFGLKLPVYGHRDFAKKACPSFDAKKEYR